ncbi:MAG: branched-chain amino acid aminotransferase [Desulfovibrio sp.]|jgi:branched-chain amino acid aminotransferase|nr:branched-chain amino acid aminotransferase [Desulfovibrio sp.]
MQIAYDLLPRNKRQSPPGRDVNLGFGLLRTNHMFQMEYADGVWRNACILPYQPFSIMPGAVCLHYGQTIFEGIKAFRHEDGEIRIFRGDINADRLNHSARIMCMPPVPPDLQMEAIMRLIDVERDWCPVIPESSLYIRPFMFATMDALGVRPSTTYVFCVILSPSGPYYARGISEAITLLINKSFHRAAPGGTGSAKCGGNYGASLRAAEEAHSRGASQVLYLNTDNTRIEEAGSMNHYHVLADGTFVIPTFSDTVLRSITSLSVLELAEAGEIKARQEDIPLEPFLKGISSGDIIEAGGFGTAAVVSPVGRYCLEDGTVYTVGDGGVGRHSLALYTRYSAIQTGKAPAPEGWLRTVPRYS